MKLNTTMMKIVESILLESTFESVYKKLKVGNIIKITEPNNQITKFEVVNVGTDFVSVIDSNGNKYGFSSYSFKGNILTLSDSDGDMIYINVSNIDIIGKKENNTQPNANKPKGDEPKGDEPEGDNQTDNVEDIQNKIIEFENVIKNLNNGDSLVITTERHDEGELDSIVNDIFFKLKGIENGFLILDLETVEPNVDGEFSSTTEKSLVGFTGGVVKINLNKLFYINDNKITINISVTKNNQNIDLQLVNIIEVQSNDINTAVDYDDNDKKYSPDEIRKQLVNDPTYRSMLNKSPTLWDTLTKASPKGLLQLRKLMDKHVVDNSYLTKGNVVTFKLISRPIPSGDTNDSLQNKKNFYYKGKVTSDMTLKLGDLNTGHWDIKLLDEIKKSTFKCEVSFCKKNKCTVKTRKAVIKILNNG